MSAGLRIAYETTTVVPRRSGIGRVVEQLAYALDRTARVGDELYVLTNGEPLERLKSAPRRGPLRPTPLWMQMAVPRVAREERFDLFHFTNSTAPVNFTAPYVTTIHDLSLMRMPEMHPLRRRAYQRTLLKSSAARARLVITISQASAHDLQEYLGVPTEKIVVTHVAADDRFHAPVDAEAIERVAARYALDGPYLLYVGTIEPRKNLVRLIDAFESARVDGVTLVLAGGIGWMAADVARRANGYAGRGRIRMLGYVDDDELPALYRAAQAVVYPSLWEGFGLPVLEAMTVGAPVIASRIPAITEVAGQAALLVDPSSTEEIGAAIAQVVSDSALRARLSADGLERSRLFDWDHAAQATWQVYRDALARIDP